MLWWAGGAVPASECPAEQGHYDSVTGDVNLAPRGSFTAVASGDGRTVVRGGIGLFYNPLPLNVASFEQVQRRVVTRFAQDGSTALGPALEMPNIVWSGLRTPCSVTRG